MLNQEKCPSGFEFTFEAILDSKTAYRQVGIQLPLIAYR
jgi:hypothetical protein